MLAIVAPGQGAQKPGMLIPWLEVDGLTKLLAGWSDGAGLDLRRLGTQADADEIKNTAVTQPLVVASALLASAQLVLPDRAATAGHSVGEFAAAALAGVLAPETAIAVAARRGRAMAQAAALTATSMAACMNPDIELVLAELHRRDLVGANVNGAGQVVAAGSAAAIAALLADPPTGVRVIALSVAGAFHTAYMASAQDVLADALAGVPTHDPIRPLLTNADGSIVVAGDRYLQLLVEQITSPVRWDKCMGTLSSLGVTGVLELPPAGTLVGLVKRELKGVATMALKTPDQLDAAAAFISAHGSAA